MLSTELRDNSNLQLHDGRVLVDINDSPNSIPLLRSTASRGNSQCFCKHSEDVLESVFECRNPYATVSREMIFWSYFFWCYSHRGLRREIIISQVATLFSVARRLFSRLFFFHIPILKRIAFHVYRASTVRRRLRVPNAQRCRPISYRNF